MDPVFHALTGLVVSKSLVGWYLPSIAIFSALPDILGTTPYYYFVAKYSSKESFLSFWKDFYKIAKQERFFSKIDRFAYRSMHSLLALLIVTLFSLIFSKEMWWLNSAGYFSHLLVDALSHEEDFAQRPLYPFLDWKIRGKSWGSNKAVFVLFWIFLILVFLLQ